MNKFEYKNIELFMNIIRDKKCIIDKGAYIGVYTLIASKTVSNDAMIYSFEPSSEVFLELLENISLNNASNIQAYNLALSDKDELTDFYICQDQAYNSHAEKTMQPIIKISKVKAIKLEILLKRIKSIELISLIVIQWVLNI